MSLTLWKLENEDGNCDLHNNAGVAREESPDRRANEYLPSMLNFVSICHCLAALSAA